MLTFVIPPLDCVNLFFKTSALCLRLGVPNHVAPIRAGGHGARSIRTAPTIDRPRRPSF